LRLAVVWCSGLILILVGANYSPSRTSLLSHPLVMWIAAVSYPFYLVHSLALHIWNHLWTVKDGGFGAFAFVICGTLGTAFLFAWILYDQLSRRWSLAPAVVTPQRRPAVVSARAVVA
jgi:peptidoglycan/LPS O-acetylase OafA/YrhL